MSPPPHGSSSTIGFLAQSPEQADACHAAWRGQRRRNLRRPPGWREGPGGKLYLAYLRDPDGNKLCCCTALRPELTPVCYILELPALKPRALGSFHSKPPSLRRRPCIMQSARPPPVRQGLLPALLL